MLLVVGGIKGGSGKTTLATNLAVCCASKGRKVLLVDADEQQSARDWNSQRYANSDFEYEIFFDFQIGKEIHKRLSDYKSLFDDVIVDTGGRDTTSQRASLVVCDGFLVPFRPRSLDIWTLSGLKKLNREIREVNPNFRIMAVLNQCDPRGTDTGTARKIIEDEKVFCLPTEIGNRKAFSNAVSEGRSVIELKSADKKSITEILRLHDDIYKSHMLDIENNHGINI